VIKYARRIIIGNYKMAHVILERTPKSIDPGCPKNFLDVFRVNAWGLPG